MVTIPLEPYLTENRTRLTEMGYNERQILAAARHNGLLIARKSVEAGEEVVCRICDELTKQGEKVPKGLAFKQWNGEYLIMVDAKGYNYCVPGSWWDCRYIVRGLIRQRARNKPWFWLINGQADKGSIQVGCFGEHIQFRFPEFDGVGSEWVAALNEGGINERARLYQESLHSDV